MKTRSGILKKGLIALAFVALAHLIALASVGTSVNSFFGFLYLVFFIFTLVGYIILWKRV